MKEFGPSQDREGRAIREMLLYRGRGPSGSGFRPVRAALLRALAAVTDDFESIRQAAEASTSSDDDTWRAYMYGECGLADDWFREFSGPMLARLAPGVRGTLRAEFDTAMLDFAGFFIPEACKLLAQDLRTKPNFLKAKGSAVKQIACDCFVFQVCPKAQIFAGLTVLGYLQVSGAQAADLPHYLGALDAFAQAIEAEVGDNATALEMLCKGDLAIGLSVVLEDRRLRKADDRVTPEVFEVQARVLVKTVGERFAEWAKLPSRGRAAYVTGVDLGGGGAVHNPLRILTALELYYAAIAAAPTPERSAEAFDPDALKAVPWTKLRHVSFVRNAESLNAAVGEDGDSTLLDMVDGGDRADVWGYQAMGDAADVKAREEQALIKAGYMPDPVQKSADQRVGAYLMADLPGEETLGMALLHDILPKLKEDNPGARNAFLVKWKDMVKELAARLTALSASNNSIPKKASTNQSGKPSWATVEDTGFGPYLVAAHTFIGARLKSLADVAQGDVK